MKPVQYDKPNIFGVKLCFADVSTSFTCRLVAFLVTLSLRTQDLTLIPRFVMLAPSTVLGREVKPRYFVVLRSNQISSGSTHLR